MNPVVTDMNAANRVTVICVKDTRDVAPGTAIAAVAAYQTVVSIPKVAADAPSAAVHTSVTITTGCARIFIRVVIIAAATDRPQTATPKQCGTLDRLCAFM